MTKRRVPKRVIEKMKEQDKVLSRSLKKEEAQFQKESNVLKRLLKRFKRL